MYQCGINKRNIGIYIENENTQHVDKVNTGRETEIYPFFLLFFFSISICILKYLEYILLYSMILCWGIVI